MPDQPSHLPLSPALPTSHLSQVQRRLQAPFPSHLVGWKPQALTKDRSRALLVAYVDARAVQDRLDAVCPDDWSFEIAVVPGTPTPTVKGRLTVLGVTREDIGEAGEGEAGTRGAASSDALKRCAVQFGIGRYLYDLPKTWVDWNDARREPAATPELPEWARPEYERTAGGAHLAQAMEQLRHELPEDLDLQREVYKHLKAALGSIDAFKRSQDTPA
ncbi:Rad52/22 double-strand break repair protein [Deinococcus phoenicis]|uniref:Rad52/22 double-strand break repair protein n=1 Tax=Deinococcus phoenicis TaxID=1476583 RepID=A0A016QJM1_9DEIO|nr:Rad52/Rad22 family DNA repair protein [Deinococcus phoenicis]EYB66375.1 Rad52/22 double-strand break repair protein [Deinococcus phoenicis]